MKRSILSLSFIAISLFLYAAEPASQFKFKQSKGDSGSYISTVEEDVYINGTLNHHAQIINRITSSVVNVANDKEAFIYATYMTTEDSVSNRSGKHLSWGEESTSVFMRKENGMLTISDDIYMPTVRNVPVFPNKKLKVGDSWTAGGKEVQDVRKAFNMDKALIFPFEANYTYVKDITENDKKLNVIEVEYTFSYISPEESLQNGCTLYSSEGYSKQTLYWDNKKGLLDHYNEVFKINIKDVMGNIYIFTGNARAEMTQYKSVNDDATVQELQDSFKQMDLDNISVKKGEKGLTISLDRIQFEPDSNILLDTEKIKIQKLAGILSNYSNDLLITGHCAARGSKKARQQLSEERAESVAAYLEELGVRDEYHIFTQGKGSEEPIATNSTEEGRSLNRRVEITIMD
ncbi:MAG: OmpA family protein [Treponema sp.]|nr:OmpA family protein [Treponema sp.]